MPSIKPSANVYSATFGALLGALSMGLSLGYTAPAFLDMERDPSKSPLNQTDEIQRESQKSLIGSILAIGALVGGLLGEPSNKLLGRRISLIVYGIPFAVGWCLIATANNVTMLVIGRILTGLCSGLSSSTAPTYVVEIAPPKIRGLLGTCFQMMTVLGVLMASIFGTFLSWRTQAFCSMVPSVGMTIIMLFMPETPQWLLDRGHHSKAQASLVRLRSSPIERELESMVQATKQSGIRVSGGGGGQYSWDIIWSYEFYKPIVFALGLMFFQQFSGVNAIMFYLTDIFSKVAPYSDADQSLILVCLTQSIATCVGSLMVDRVGRRTLLIISGAGHAISLATFGWYCRASTDDIEFQSRYAWIALASLIVYIVFFSIGFGPIAWLMIPELASSRVRSLVASIATAFNWACVYAVTATVKSFVSRFGDAWTYWSFAILCLTSCLFAHFILPETKGKTSEQIQAELVSPRSEPPPVASKVVTEPPPISSDDSRQREDVVEKDPTIVQQQQQQQQQQQRESFEQMMPMQSEGTAIKGQLFD